MKLYLASLRIPDETAYLQLFDNKPGTIGVITNAWLVAPAEKAKPFIDATVNQLQAMGFTTKMVNLLDYVGKKDELRDLLAELDGVWVTGGNTFFLNWCMRESGFSELLRPALKNGLVYGGESAGAAVMGTTLHGIEILDDPKEGDKPFDVIWDGIGLVDYGIIPHWGKEKYKKYFDAVYNEMSKFTTIKTLTDAECIVVNTAD